MAPTPMHCMWPHSAVHLREQSWAMALPPCSMRQFLVRKGCAGCRAGLWRPTRRACAGHCLLRAVHGTRERAPRPAEQNGGFTLSGLGRAWPPFVCGCNPPKSHGRVSPRVAGGDRIMIPSRSCPGLHASHPGYFTIQATACVIRQSLCCSTQQTWDNVETLFLIRLGHASWYCAP